MNVQVDAGKIQTTTLISQPIDPSAFIDTLHMLIDLGSPVIAFDHQQVDLMAQREESLTADGRPPTPSYS